MQIGYSINLIFSNRATTAYNIKMIQGNYDLDYNTVKHWFYFPVLFEV